MLIDSTMKVEKKITSVRIQNVDKIEHFNEYRLNNISILAV
jgi:hypothetical protein